MRLQKERTLLAKSCEARDRAEGVYNSGGKSKSGEAENDERNLPLLVPFDLSVILLLVFALVSIADQLAASKRDR